MAHLQQIDLPGVTYKEGEVAFARDTWDEPLARLAACAMTGGRVRLNLNASFGGSQIRMAGHGSKKKRRRRFTPNEDHLDLINEHHSDVDLAMGEVFIFERFPANDVASRSHRVIFTRRALRKFAADAAQGRARLIGHDTRLVVGRTIDASVRKAEVRGIEGAYLSTIEYMVRTESNADLIRNVEAGILSYDSIGVYLGTSVEMVEMENTQGHSAPILRVDFDPKAERAPEMDEVSFVYLGELQGVGSRHEAGNGQANGQASGLNNDYRTPDDVLAPDGAAGWDAPHDADAPDAASESGTQASGSGHSGQSSSGTEAKTGLRQKQKQLWHTTI